MNKEVESLQSRFPGEMERIENHLRFVVETLSPCPHPGLKTLWKSVEHSLFSGGKRFRPLLSVLTAEALDRDSDRVLPLAAAVELIHTYSLIHDDLPCMDDDDVRRGQPTNHKVYGEAMALLAGDGLLTLAFLAVAQSPAAPAAVVQAVQCLATAAGLSGMVGGQVLDVGYQKEQGIEMLERVHALKTGALIRSAVEGAALLSEASPDQLAQLKDYGSRLGWAFQLADDIQDADEKETQEAVSYVALLGEVKTRELLAEVSAKAHQALEGLPHPEGLHFLIDMNLQRIDSGV